MARLPKLLCALVGCSYLLLSQGQAADTTTIAAFGDSLFAGLGVAANEAYPVRLEQRLQQDGYSVKIINLGISGDTTAGGLSRIESVLQQKPNLVLIELGGNDLLRGMPPAEVKRNLDGIMSRFKQANITMILIGQKAPFTLGAPYADAYNAMFPELAASYGAPLYPVFLEGVYGVPGLMQQDGVHPTKEGVDALVVNTAPLVEQSLRK